MESGYILNNNCFMRSADAPCHNLYFFQGTTFGIVSQNDKEVKLEAINSNFEAIVSKEDFEKYFDEIVTSEGYVIWFDNDTWWCGNNKTDKDCRNAQIYKSAKNCFEWADKIMEKPVIKNNKFVTDYKVRKITVSVNETIERPNRS